MLIINLYLINNTYALETESKTWGVVNLSGQLFNIPNLEYVLEEQPRYDNSQSQFQRNLAKAGIGYQYTPNLSFWLGYQYLTENYVSGAAPENRAWQQMNWTMINQKNYNLTSQSQFDETYRIGETDWADKFRQKLIVKFPDKLYDKYTPVVSDEVFINITRPAWITTRVLNQNRAFIGVDIPTSKQTYLEVGYLNQYVFEETSANEMNNILFVGFYIST